MHLQQQQFTLLPQHAANNQFNTLPAQVAGASAGANGGINGGAGLNPASVTGAGGARLPGHIASHNTLPARVNGHGHQVIFFEKKV